MRIKITDHEISSIGVVKYFIESKTEATHLAVKRYSELKLLHESLKTEYLEISDFPPKKIFWNTNVDFINERKTALQSWLDDLCKLPNVEANETVREFFQLDEVVPLKSNESEEQKILEKLQEKYNALIEKAKSEFMNLGNEYSQVYDESERIEKEKIYRLMVADLDHKNRDLTFPGSANSELFLSSIDDLKVSSLDETPIPFLPHKDSKNVKSHPTSFPDPENLETESPTHQASSEELRPSVAKTSGDLYHTKNNNFLQNFNQE